MGNLSEILSGGPKIKLYKTGVINDPLGQTHSHASSEHCFLLFCLARFEKWGRTYGRTTCAETIIPTGRDFGLAEWIKNIHLRQASHNYWSTRSPHYCDHYFYTFKNFAKQKYQVKIVITTGGTVGLAEWIIYNASLVEVNFDKLETLAHSIDFSW